MLSESQSPARKGTAMVFPEGEESRLASSPMRGPNSQIAPSSSHSSRKEQRKLQMLKIYNEDSTLKQQDLTMTMMKGDVSGNAGAREQWKQKQSQMSVKSEKLSEESQERIAQKPPVQVINFGDTAEYRPEANNMLCSATIGQCVNLTFRACLIDIYSWFYFLTIILCFLDENPPKSPYWFIVGLILNAGVNASSVFKHHRLALERLQAVDNTLVSVYNPLQKEFSLSRVGLLQVGQIIKISYLERVPADCILLATMANDIEVTFNEVPNEGNRINVQLAKLINFETLQIQSLSGKIEFEGSHPLKKGSPTMLTYSYNNVPNEFPLKLEKQDLILRGWKSTQEQDLILVVLRVGYRCKNLRHGNITNLFAHCRPNQEFKSQTTRISGLMLLLCFGISLMLAGLQIYMRDTKFSGMLYLSGVREQTFAKAWMEFFIIFTSLAPIFQWPLYHLMMFLSALKVNRGAELDPQIRGEHATVNNVNTLYTMSKARFVNVSADALSRDAITVSKGMVCRQVFDEVEYEHRVNLVELDEHMYDREGFELEEIQGAFEAGLLSLGIDERSIVDVGLQNYFLQMNMIHYTRGRKTPRIVQLPDENLKKFKQVLQLFGSDSSYSITAYEIPFDKKQLKKIRKTNRSFKPEPSYLIIYRCSFEQAKMFLDSGVVQQLPTQQINIDNMLVISKKTISLIDFRAMLKLLPVEALKQFTLTEDFSIDLLNNIHERLTPMVTVETQKAVAHSLLCLVDLSRADIKTWIYSDYKDIGQIEFDPNYTELKIYFSKHELVNLTDEKLLVEAFDRLYLAFNLPKEDTLDPSNTVIKCNDLKVVLVVDYRTAKTALCHPNLAIRFKRLVLLPQYVVYLGCSQRLRRELVLIQQEYRAAAVSVINGLSDLVLCQEHTYNLSLSEHYSAWSDVVLPAMGSTSMLLFNHARLTNIRISEFILYMTYSAMALSIAELTYTPFNGYSGDMMYGSTLHFLYSYLFVGLYGAFLFSFKIDIQARFFRKHSHLMQLARDNHYFTFKRVLQSMAWGVYHGVICTCIPILIMQGSNDLTGTVQGHYLTTMCSYLLLLTIVTTKPLFNMELLQTPQMIGYFVNFGFFMFILSQVCQSTFTRLYEPSLIFAFQTVFQITKVFCAVMFVPLGILLPNFMALYNFKLFAKHPHTKALKKTEKELDEEYQRYLDRQARNIINEEEEEMLEKQNQSAIFDEKQHDAPPPQSAAMKGKDI